MTVGKDDDRMRCGRLAESVVLKHVALAAGALVAPLKVVTALAADAVHGLALIDVNAVSALQLVAAVAGAEEAVGEVGASVGAAAVVGFALVDVWKIE